MRRVQWGIPSAVFSLVFAIFLALATARLTSDYLGLSDAESLLWSLLAQSVGLLFVPLLISHKRGLGPKNDFALSFEKKDLIIGIRYGFLMILVALILASIQMIFVGEFTSAAAQASIVFQENVRLLIIFIVAVALIGPFVEEVAFRGMWFGALERKFHSSTIAIIGSSLVFSIIHFEIQRVLLIFITGLILGHLRAKTNSLGAPVIAHIVNNTPGALGFLVLANGPVPI